MGPPASVGHHPEPNRRAWPGGTSRARIGSGWRIELAAATPRRKDPRIRISVVATSTFMLRLSAKRPSAA